MPKFRVLVKEVHYAHYDVEAKNKKEAKLKAEEMIGGEDFPHVEYSHTGDKKSWHVFPCAPPVCAPVAE